jgi:acyl-CoA synthetase (AMP-forming)/AMP-acid ligase II
MIVERAADDLLSGLKNPLMKYADDVSMHAGEVDAGVDALFSLFDCFRHISHYAGKGHTYIEPGNITAYRSYADLFDDAIRVHTHLFAKGLRCGDRVGLLAANTRHFIAAFLGCVRGGLIPVPICPPGFNSRDAAYADQLGSSARISGARYLVTPEVLQAAASLTFGDISQITYESMHDGVGHASAPTPAAAEVSLDDICFLQFGAGSTGDPKGIMVTHRNVAANARAIMVHGIGITNDDIGVSWLPLSVSGYETEKVVVLAEANKNHVSASVLDDIRKLLLLKAGIVAQQILLLQPGSIPKSTSGKVQRRLAKLHYLRAYFSKMAFAHLSPLGQGDACQTASCQCKRQA